MAARQRWLVMITLGRAAVLTICYVLCHKGGVILSTGLLTPPTHISYWTKLQIAAANKFSHPQALQGSYGFQLGSGWAEGGGAEGLRDARRRTD